MPQVHSAGTEGDEPQEQTAQSYAAAESQIPNPPQGYCWISHCVGWHGQGSRRVLHCIRGVNGAVPECCFDPANVADENDIPADVPQ
jgi:hypothetical protein